MNIPIFQHLRRGLLDNPLILKEIRVASRQNSSFLAVLIFLIAGLGVAFLPILLDQADDPTAVLPVNRMPILGRRLFVTLLSIQAILIFILSITRNHRSIIGEKTERTWHMLVMCQLTAGEIVFGKLLGSLYITLIFLAASLPLYGLCLVLGGVRAAEIGQAFGAMLLFATLVSLATLDSSAAQRVGERKFSIFRVIGMLALFFGFFLPASQGIVQFILFYFLFRRGAAAGGLTVPISFFAQTLPLWTPLAALLAFALAAAFFDAKQRVRHPAALKTPWPRLLILALLAGAQLFATGYLAGASARANPTDWFPMAVFLWSLSAIAAPLVLFGEGRFDFPRLAETRRWDRWVGRHPLASIWLRGFYPSHLGGLVTATLWIAIALAPLHFCASVPSYRRYDSIDTLALACFFYVTTMWATAGILIPLLRQVAQVKVALALLTLVPVFIGAAPIVVAFLRDTAVPARELLRWDFFPPAAYLHLVSGTNPEGLTNGLAFYAFATLLLGPASLFRRREIVSRTTIRPVEG